MGRGLCLLRLPGDCTMERMHGPHRQTPYQLLGQRLKLIREKRQESLAEASGAVEIDIEALERIENGEECPSEEILMLLINHFCVREHEAVELWEWAGYDQASEPRVRAADNQAKGAFILVALDVRAVYSDGLALNANNSGMILSFTQSTGQDQSQVVARVGMSYQQVEATLHLLQQALLRSRYMPDKKLLPPSVS